MELQRRSVRDTVEPPTPTAQAISSSPAPGSGRQQDLRPLQLTRCMFAAAQQHRQLVAFRFAQLDPVPYIHSDLLEGETRRIEP
jgi:hypothetical protein